MRKIDLHGMRYEDAKRAVEKFVNGCSWQWGDVLPVDKEGEIITGHSPNMREMVIEILKEYNIEYHVGGPLGVDDTYIKVY